MRATGKSNIARQIAKTLKRKHIDIDKEIERQEHMPIAKIVKVKGWPYFRKIEKYVTRRLAKYDGIVISTGGGTMTDPENVKKLKKQGIVVLLTAPVSILAKRLSTKEQANRPALTKGGQVIAELEKIWQQRQAKYEACADYQFDVSAHNLDFKKDIKTKSRGIIELVAHDHAEFRKPE